MTIQNRHTILGLLASTTIMVMPVEAAAQDTQRYAFDIPAQDLGDTLRTVAATANWQLYATADDVNGVSAPQLRGSFTAREAIENLLRGTRLVARFDNQSVIIRGRSEAHATLAQVPEEAIVVTGTRIEGAPSAAPVIVVTSNDIKNAGFADLGDLARSLPQNFGGGQNPGVGSAQGTQNENVNVNGASTFNLRGIGPNATLTLLNGNRFAYSGNNSVIDVSAIPVAAVERVEIVADGASAIYGADAVAGVVNILLRKDYRGITTSARLGGSTDGGNFQQQYTLLAGTNWSTGGLIAVYDRFDNSAIRAGDRTYSSSSNPASTFYPDLQRHSVLLSGHQQLGVGIGIKADLIYKRGDMTSVRGLLADRPIETSGTRVINKFETFGIAPMVEVELGARWNARVTGFYGTDETLGTTDIFTNGSTRKLIRIFDNRNIAVEAGVEGPLLALPAGEVRLAAGGGWRHNRIHAEFSGRNITPTRENKFAYGELFVPLASPAQNLGFVHRASLTAALRWEDYSDSGSIVTPKLGLVFAPAAELSLGVSWGRSFKMPTLIQQYTGYAAVLYPVTGYGNRFRAGSNFLYIGGPNPEVGPERAENLTLSANFRPSPRLQIVTSFFNIDYRDRVAPPLSSVLGALTNPLYASLVTFNPTVAQLNAAIAGAAGPLGNGTTGPYDPSNVIALLDGRDRNIAEQRYQGADLAIRYRVPLTEGRTLSFSAGATWLDSQQRLLPGLPTTNLAGNIFRSPHFRARGGATLDSANFTLAAFTSFTGGVTDRRRPVPIEISPVATFDLTGRIKLRGLADVTISALNIFNSKPDQILVAAPDDTPFDSTNYSAVGRFLALTISRDW
ncbi:TonB-dependent receptor [Sphingopyxis witflariensis]|uniref:TonB-dependent receptor n=1 Tax=Sphingopyxis witflariensis TaxID=173675 RepID=A0A246K6F7_9SPHN|nr:TonB-dependent receptor [Sphingopyxis witflariensis]OWR01601.1 TonB-dependent receptor [Sphingopyxis witflariensis]